MNIISLLIFSSPLVFLLISFSKDKLIRFSFICFTALLLFLILAFRHNVGFDYSSYIEIFNLSDECYYEPVTCRILYISQYFDSYVLLFAIYALLTIGCVLFVSVSEKSPFILLNYICFPWFFIESFSIIRQELSIAFAIVMYLYFNKKDKNLKFLLFAALSVLSHLSSLLFVLLLIYLKFFGKNKMIKKLVFIFVSSVSLLLFLFYENIITYYPVLQFYNNGQSFGYSMYFLFVLLYITMYKNIIQNESMYILSLAIFIYIGTLSIDSSLARISIPFIIPALWFRWSVLFNKIHLGKFQLHISYLICVCLYIVSLYVKSNNSVSTLIPYKSIFPLII